MGIGAKRCIAFGGEDARHILYEYANGRTAQMTQMMPAIPFRLTVYKQENAPGEDVAVTDHYMTLMLALCRFFAKGLCRFCRKIRLKLWRCRRLDGALVSGLVHGYHFSR